MAKDVMVLHTDRLEILECVVILQYVGAVLPCGCVDAVCDCVHAQQVVEQVKVSRRLPIVGNV